MPDSTEKTFLGRGWSFPPGFNKIICEVQMVTEEEDIRQSLTILLSTRRGERTMRSEYGCNLDIMLFEPITTTLITRAMDQIRTSILYHEPRIDLNNISLDTSRIRDGIILIDLIYTQRRTNSRFNLVYPFYLNEGSNIQLTE